MRFNFNLQEKINRDCKGRQKINTNEHIYKTEHNEISFVKKAPT
jgi:hypothetical protein